MAELIQFRHVRKSWIRRARLYCVSIHVIRVLQEIGSGAGSSAKSK